MKFKLPYQDNRLGSMLANLGIVFSILLLLAVSYFYVYLPGVTNHGESITVPNLQGMKLEELPEFLASHDLRYTVYDSAYSEEYPSLSVLQQLLIHMHRVLEQNVRVFHSVQEQQRIFEILREVR